MKIGIIGTRGIPNEYGGFEQFATDFACDAVQLGHDVTVYCSSLHSYKQEQFKGVRRVICHDPEFWLGISGQFFYDLNCILHTRKCSYDAILQLGYTSSSIWNFLLPSTARIVTNMDGMEWKRSKYNFVTQRFLKYAESLAAKHSDLLIADSTAIADYLQKSYANQITYIPYGALPINHFDDSLLGSFSLKPFNYYLVIARMEPENNIRMIVEGYLKSKIEQPLVIIGNLNNYGKALQNEFKSSDVKFIGGMYNQTVLNTLRHFAKLYFHGHSVGGTNPSLLEAMACGVPIAAHNNPFNRAVLKENGIYFNTHDDVASIFSSIAIQRDQIIKENLKTLVHEFDPNKIHHQLINVLQK